MRVPVTVGSLVHEDMIYHVVPYRHTVRESEGLGARVLVLKCGPNHDLPLWVKSASKSDWLLIRSVAPL